MHNQYPIASITASNILPLYWDILLLLTSGWPLLFIITITNFLSLSAQAITPVEPSWPKQLLIFDEGQFVSKPYDLVF